ncbi:DnaB helicase C-terminal domain-containing protein, partial [Salmonella enterica]
VSVLERNAAVRNSEAVIEHALAGIRNASSGEAAAGALKSAQDAMAAISLTPDTVQPAHIDEILPAVVDRVDARYQGLEEAKLLMTGIEELDEKTGGIEPTDLVIIAARPSMGKTELALDIIDKVSEQGHGVLFFSMEMPGIQIGERMVSAAGGMPVSRLKAAAKFKDEDWARLSTGIGHLTGRNIWMVDATDLTLEQIQKTATSHQIAHPEIALVVIDYLLLIKIQSTTRYDLAVGEISKGLKRLARTNRTPVLALSQLSRGVDSRPNKRPMNSDLKNSGEIEADADIILMLYRDEVYNPDSPARGIAEINITKQRNGVLGTVYRRFYNGHFLPIDQEEAKRKSEPQQKPRRYAKN